MSDQANRANTDNQCIHPRAIIPPGEPETVQQLVKKEVGQLLAAHRAAIDLEYRIKRYKELSSRHRALRSEVADVRRQMEALNLPPQLLRTLKEE